MPLFMQFVFWIRLDLIHFGSDLDPDSIEISQNHGKFPQKSTQITRILCIFFLNIKVLLTDMNIYLKNNNTHHSFWRNIFLIEKKVFKNLVLS